MAQSDPQPADIEEEGISIWLALCIAVALLAVGVLLTRAAKAENFIPSSGTSEDAFFNDVVNHALPDTPLLETIQGDPRALVAWQESRALPTLDLPYLGIRQSVGSTALYWNEQPVCFSAVKVEAVTVMLYLLAPTWEGVTTPSTMMMLSNQGREIISWHHGPYYYVAITFDEGATFPEAWKHWLMRPPETDRPTSVPAQ